METAFRFKFGYFFPVVFFLILSLSLNAQWRRVGLPSLPSNVEYIWCFSQTSFFENGLEAKYQFAGTSGGFFISNNYGDSWTKFSTGLNSSDLNILSINARGKTIYAAGYGGVFRSDNLGIQWTSIASYNNGFTVPAVTSMVINDPNLIAATITGKVFRSSDAGASWQIINSGLPENLLRINQLYLANNSFPPYIFAATSSSVFVNPNNSIQWYYAGSGIPSTTEIYSIVNIGNTMLAGTLNGVYRSTNMGTRWDKVVNAPVWAFYNFSVYGPYIFAGTGFGVYLSSDGGNNWTDVSQGSIATTVYSTTIWDKYLVAGTYQQGVWRRPLSEMGVVSAEHEDVPANFNLSQNYPNPFNASTRIKYSLAVKSKIQITIYNVLGQTIARPVDEIKPPGFYSLDWDGNYFPSGIYFYKYDAIPAGGFNTYSETRKMLLLK